MSRLPGTLSGVVVGLSGGVDSSVALVMLQKQGYPVVGLTLWLMKGKGQCCSDGMVDAAQLCQDLGVDHHVVDSRQVFESQIVDYLVAGYSAGITPLPCSQCNRAVKFGPMLAYARQELGLEHIATGHYARIHYNPDTQRYELWRAVDSQKDQSYFLYDLPQDVLAQVIFPLGDQTKDITRQIAAQFNLHTAEKPESQDLCLIEAHGSMAKFLDQYIAPQKGDIVDRQGKVLGTHQGVHHYTIGQRKGLGIAASEPLYVIGLNVAKNQVVVGDRRSGGQPDCHVQRINWVSIAAPKAPIAVEVQIRYRTAPVAATIIPLAEDQGERVRLIFDEPQFGVTPGQAAVWYQGDHLLGGGIIEPFSP
ncbi:tRNA 2-thiouridine(34) synthase MnmA [Candidatus Synechococcus calcipolaris G9]|uniref:tRNA-specific 2-thiouridylase MnmA n=1 Tax=Candidatus Synechococcus calcipolaris G9 TaxID=1497997 RepID=A0ABT6F343_9SYNE|nr:tRNA 2-thiouridine(34) synthase MnmA [Candidatus Synechococcus calcipolaris]MDG2992203.1 tRNA 2-thiouridine(34) synthase MnmA [Candidatus Synechococcus calcipolaris G9]